MFVLTESCEGLYMIGFEEELLGCQRGSYNVMGARVLGLEYPDYLRFCRDEHNAILQGKQGYSYPLFKVEKDAQNLIKVLNKQYIEIRTKLIELDFFKKL